jgi:trimethylamine--corrinoid protein Co-methyltransferase
VVDAQSGHEKTITGMLPALAGANVIYGLGMLEMGITFDLTQLVIDNEIAEMIKYAVKGIPVNDETLAVDVITEMGIGKDYLSHETTYRNMATQSRAELMDRRMREDWEADGSADIYKRAHDKMTALLESYEPPALSGSVLTDIREIVKEAEKEQGVG